jgi:hypothetical protein
LKVTKKVARHSNKTTNEVKDMFNQERRELTLQHEKEKFELVDQEH